MDFLLDGQPLRPTGERLPKRLQNRLPLCTTVERVAALLKLSQTLLRRLPAFVDLAQTAVRLLHPPARILKPFKRPP